MKIKYLESEGFFTSNGFFKIWNYSSGENFPIFGQKFVPTLLMTYPLIEGLYLLETHDSCDMKGQTHCISPTNRSILRQRKSGGRIPLYQSYYVLQLK